MTSNQAQAAPATPEQDKGAVAPAESRPVEQPAKAEPQSTPEKKS
jgi:hypothetical protein